MFNTLMRLNCHSRYRFAKWLAANLLEKLYGCEVNCSRIHESTRFAHHARGCTIAAAKICEGVVIYQNVTVGANLRFNRIAGEWENVGTPILSRNVIVCDGAKILGPVVIGENTVVAAGAIVTKDVPADSVAYGTNRFRPKAPGYDLVFRRDMIDSERILDANRRLVEQHEAAACRESGPA